MAVIIARRKFMTALASAAALPIGARAQQPERTRRIGWLEAVAEGDEVSRANRVALFEALAGLGWVDGRNLKIDQRFGSGNPVTIRSSAAELAGLGPDLIVASGAAATRAAQAATQTIPIVFTGGGDAAAIGLVKNIARPEGNTTGFSSSEPTVGGKWLELLKQAVPQLTRVAVVFNPELGPTVPQYFSTIDPAARRLAIETIRIPFRDSIALVRAIDSFASGPNGGLLMLPPPGITERVTIIKLAAEHRLPAIYPQRFIAVEGGLISYGADTIDQVRRAASYVDRILRGTKVIELPVQFPTKYQLVVNIRTAKAIDVAIPETFLLHVDEIIE
jgi:putative ABC transport system substrate-binding protein